MTPDQYKELSLRVVKMRFDTIPHYGGRHDLDAITNFEKLTHGKLVSLPSDRDAEILKRGEELGRITIAVVKWNVREVEYYTWNPTEERGARRSEQGICLIGDNHVEMLQRIYDHVMQVKDIIVGSPDDPRCEGGLSTYFPI